MHIQVSEKSFEGTYQLTPLRPHPGAYRKAGHLICLINDLRLKGDDSSQVWLKVAQYFQSKNCLNTYANLHPLSSTPGLPGNRALHLYNL